MFCPRCHTLMNKRMSGCAYNTVEFWSCGNQECGYTFEMRQSARGFNYCFEQERDLSPPAEHASRDRFPNRVFEIGRPGAA